MIDKLERVKSALESIVANSQAKALNYAVNYAKYSIYMIEQGYSEEDVRTQVLYVLDNMSKWKGDTATVTRGILKEFVSMKEGRHGK